MSYRVDNYPSTMSTPAVRIFSGLCRTKLFDPFKTKPNSQPKMPSSKQIIASLALAGAAAVSADSFNGVERELMKVEATAFIPSTDVLAVSFDGDLHTKKKTDYTDVVLASAEVAQGHISYFE